MNFGAGEEEMLGGLATAVEMHPSDDLGKAVTRQIG
jgi:hypothetical protein